MYSFKKSLATLVGRLALAALLAALLPPAGLGQTDAKNPLKRDARRSFYLTQTTHNGAQALSACAEGFHMASLWEIFDTSNLRYDIQLGFTQADSGSGPPFGGGWIRTGNGASDPGTLVIPGNVNCAAWTSASPENSGSTVSLAGFWDMEVPVTSPWRPRAITCDLASRVWCVQD